MRIALYVAMITLFFLAAGAVFERGAKLHTSKVPIDSPLVESPDDNPVKSNDSFYSFVKNNVSLPFSGLLIQILVIFPATFLMARLFRGLGQPGVTGEIIAGIFLGPSVLGWIWPWAYHVIFPMHSLSTLRLMGQIGILIFMFMVGMEFNMAILRQKAHSALLISHTSIIVPFLLGLIISLFLYTKYAYGQVSFMVFSLFMGIAMSITAFPVLARIIQEKKIAGTSLGTIALASAAVDDVTAWTVFAFIAAGASSGSLANVFFTLTLLVLFSGSLFFIVRFLAEKVMAKERRGMESGVLFFSLIVLFLSSLFTEAIGLHAIFGSFLAGLVMPPSQKWRRFMSQRLEFLSSNFLLPFFFALVGIRTNISVLNDWGDWLSCVMILAVAILGKFGATALVSRFEGMDLKSSIAMGALMNTRGLMELIVLNIAYDMGIFPREIFTILVIMAIVTTLMAGPIINQLKRSRPTATAA